MNINSTISIIIPMRNEESYIGGCIKGFMNQTYPAEMFDIIIVDGFSSDKSKEIVNSYKKRFKNITLLENPYQITPYGFNIGIKKSKSDFVGIFSAHSIPEKNYLEVAVKTIKETNADCVGGPMNATNESLIGTAIAYSTSVPFGIGASKFHYSKKQGYVQTVYQGIFRKEVFDKVGFFDTDLVRNQDDEMSYRIRKNGGKIFFNPNIKSIYYNRSSLPRLAKQYYQYGLYKPLVFKKLKYGMQIHHFVPCFFVLYLVMITILNLKSFFYIPFYLYLFLDLIFCVYGKVKKISIISFIIFPVLHISYGLGFLSGFYKVLIKNNNEA